MINNRQAGRRRGRGGNNNGQRQGGGGVQGNGSRIDNRARGNATQLYEKYKNMAADAQRVSDRVNTEYYLQFADHYFRVLSEQRGRFEDQQPRRGQDFDADGSGDDGEDYGDEGEPVRAREGWSEGEQPRYANREGGEREARPRDDRPRDDRPRGDRPRDDRPRDDRPREFRRDENDGRGETRRPNNANGNAEGRGEWQDRDRQDRPRERRPVDAPAELRAEGRTESGGQHRADAIAPGESLAGRAEEVLNADRPLEAPVARRRGRPRREEASVPVLVADADALEADRLPPSLAASLTLAANDEEPAAKPRRRRARPVDEAPTAAE